jgi:hypothetical protein
MHQDGLDGLPSLTCGPHQNMTEDALSLKDRLFKAAKSMFAVTVMDFIVGVV